MANNISFNPALTTSATNSFLLDTQGYTVGTFYNDDPAIRMSLTSGQLASTVSQPVWGGLLISESVPAINSGVMGNVIAIGTADTNYAGFTVFNQAYNMALVPGNSVPIAVANMTVNYFRKGSNAQIALACSTALSTAIEGGFTNQQVSWNYTTQQLDVYNATTGALPVLVLKVNNNSKVPSYNSTTGAVTWTVGPAVIIQI